MGTPKVFESEYRFCLILWEHEPIKSSDLVALCRDQLGWKPTTIGLQGRGAGRRDRRNGGEDL